MKTDSHCFISVLRDPVYEQMPKNANFTLPVSLKIKSLQAWSLGKIISTVRLQSAFLAEVSYLIS